MGNCHDVTIVALYLCVCLDSDDILPLISMRYGVQTGFGPIELHTDIAIVFNQIDPVLLNYRLEFSSSDEVQAL